MTAELPDYDQLQDALSPAAGGHLTPAEVHGFLCGLIGGGTPMANSVWRDGIETLLNDSDPLPESAGPLVDSLYQKTCRGFAEMGFGLALYLPDDDIALPSRLEALGLWCQGFLAGFSLAPRDGALSEDVSEVLKDLSDISQIDTDVELNEEMESAYLDVTEHVRLSAQLIYAELGEKPEKPAAQSVH